MFSVLVFKFRHSNHRIGAHTCTNHTVPYGTALWGGAVPGTSCQATIAPSLRDISQQAPVRQRSLGLEPLVDSCSISAMTFLRAATASSGLPQYWSCDETLTGISVLE